MPEANGNLTPQDPESLAGRANDKGSGGWRRSDPYRQRIELVKRKARRHGGMALERVVDAFLRIAFDPTEETADRIRALENLADRFGLPRVTKIDETDRLFPVPKLFVIKHYVAPATWQDGPPASVQSGANGASSSGAEVEDEPHENGDG